MVGNFRLGSTLIINFFVLNYNFFIKNGKYKPEADLVGEATLHKVKKCRPTVAKVRANVLREAIRDSSRNAPIVPLLERGQ